MLFYITENMNQNTTEFHVLLKKSKTIIKIYVMSKHNLWFFTTSTYISSYFSQNRACKNSFSFTEPLILGSPKSPHHDSKPTRIQNSN